VHKFGSLPAEHSVSSCNFLVSLQQQYHFLVFASLCTPLKIPLVVLTLKWNVETHLFSIDLILFLVRAMPVQHARFYSCIQCFSIVSQVFQRNANRTVMQAKTLYSFDILVQQIKTCGFLLSSTCFSLYN